MTSNRTTLHRQASRWAIASGGDREDVEGAGGLS
jgi:hypothetical protein